MIFIFFSYLYVLTPAGVRAFVMNILFPEVNNVIFKTN